MFFQLLRKLFKRHESTPLTEQERLLLGTLGAAPDLVLEGPDMAVAKCLLRRGYLRRVGPHRYLLTERGIEANRRPHA